MDRRYNHSDLGGDYIRTLDHFHPSWRSIEFFGPPGAGKSHISRAIAQCGVKVSYFATVEELVDPYLTKGTKYLYNLFPHKYRYKASKRVYKRIRDHIDNYIPASWAKYVHGVNTVLRRAPIEPMDAHRYRESIVRALLSTRQHANTNRIVIDEGSLESFANILVRIINPKERYRVFQSMIPVLEDYPADKNAIMVICDVEECLRRQCFRGKRSAAPDRPQQLFHDCAEMVFEGCVKSGWRIDTLDNGDAEWSAAVSGG